MRNYLKDVEIVGAVMVYQEGEMCRWSLDWLYANCDRVCITLDNWNEETEKIVFEYRDKYPERTHIAYSDVRITDKQKTTTGMIKHRFVALQREIRQFMVLELKKMHEEKPIDLVIWPDSDETFIDEFPVYIEDFWYNSPRLYMVLGFIQIYDNFQTIYYPRMFPHARVFKYTPEMDATKGKTRCVHYPYNQGRSYAKKSIIVHICTLTEAYRQRKEFTDAMTFDNNLKRINALFWILPKDVRKMTQAEITGYNQKPWKFQPMSAEEYFKNYAKKLPN